MCSFRTPAADGARQADEIRRQLQVAGIPLWQDRDRMEGGRDWWLQITAALDTVEFMVLLMTPAAMNSPIVRKEWRYARQRGVCVYPVKPAGGTDIDFGALTVWDRATASERLRLEGHTAPVRRCAVSPDGSFIISVAYDRRVTVWDAITGHLREELLSHTDGITDCAISADGRSVSRSADRLGQPVVAGRVAAPHPHRTSRR